MLGRRKNVRVRPSPDYTIGIEFGSGFVKVRLPVLDAAVGGVGLEVVEQIAHFTAGSEIPLGVILPGFPRFETVGSLRYTQGRVGGRCGVHFDKLSEPQRVALNRFVCELLERGFSV
jgi:hypothetical protein